MENTLEIKKEETKRSKMKRTQAEGTGVKDDGTGHEGNSKNFTIKITFEGEAAKRILKCESDLKERLSKPDMGKILGDELLTWSDKRWLEIVEENTDVEFFFAQIKKCSDKSKSIKLLKALAEKLKNDVADEASQASSASEIKDQIFEPKTFVPVITNEDMMFAEARPA